MAIVGMRGTGDWTTPDERPKNYREAILYMYPNERAPLTGMLSKLKEESVNDPEFKVFLKGLPDQEALVAAAGYDNSTDPIVIPLKGTNENYNFKVGHAVINARTLEVMWVTVVSTADQITCARSKGSAAKVAGLEDDQILIIGSHHAEGADVPAAIAYAPSVVTNYTQIFRNVLNMTNTARETKLRTGDQMAEAKRECNLLHHIEMEKAFLFGVAHEGTGSNGKPERTTRGMLHHIATNVQDFSSGVQIDDFEDFLEGIFKKGSAEKMWLGGMKTVTIINRVARAYGQQMLPVAKNETFGMSVWRWLSPHGELYVKVHPLMGENATFTSWAFIFDMSQLRYRYLQNRDTKYLRNRQGPGIDGILDEFLTEAGLEGRHEDTHGLVKNFDSFIAA